MHFEICLYSDGCLGLMVCGCLVSGFKHFRYHDELVVAVETGSDETRCAVEKTLFEKVGFQESV